MTQTLEPVAKPFALAGWAGSAATTVTWAGFALTFATIPAAALSRGAALPGLARGRAPAAPLGRGRGRRGRRRAGRCWSRSTSSGWRPADSFSWPLLLSVPLAIAVAVLRYRLWDLDRLISRTVTYAAGHRGPAGLPYLLVVPAACELVAGLGEPGRGRGHPGRGRAVPAGAPPGPGPGRPALQPPPLRRRPDGGRVRGRRLRDQVDLDALHGELLAVVDQTMQPTRASLWLRGPADGASDLR